MSDAPHAIIIGGANGAGKTTFALKMLPLLASSIQFLNADEIQRSSLAFSRPIAAGAEFLRRLDVAFVARASFAVEMTLASQRYLQTITEWRAAGYTVTLHFIEVPDADFAVDRVQRRVASGGHAIPEADIRRRFDRGRANFAGRYRAAVDRYYHWWSDEQAFRLLDAS